MVLIVCQADRQVRIAGIVWRIIMVGMFDLSGKTALVTGASSGIGRGLAEGLAGAGAGVVVSARRGENLAEVVGTIEKAGGEAVAVVGDLSKGEDRERLVAESLDWRGGVDILVNCAGINRRGPSVDVSVEDWQAVLELDLTVPFLLSQAIGRSMIERGKGGSIINITSLCSSVTRAEIAAYTAAKGGLAMLTKSLAVEWGQYGIRVNAIGPGYIRTEMTQVLVDDPKFREWITSRTPAGRWGEPMDLVGPVVLLASDAGSFVNGQVIYVDGGLLARFYY